MLEVVLGGGRPCTYLSGGSPCTSPVFHLSLLLGFAAWAPSQPFPLFGDPGSLAFLSDLVLSSELWEELVTPFACFVFLVPGQNQLRAR